MLKFLTSLFRQNIFNNPRQRKVLLVMFDGALREATAVETEAGWVTSWARSVPRTQAVLLKPGGEILAGEPGMVVGWYPHTGWKDDLAFMPASCNNQQKKSS